MDRKEAAEILRRELAGYARRPRAELVACIGRVDAYSIEGRGGVAYQVEIEVRWDREAGAIIRTLGSIDDGTLRGSFHPLTLGFLMDTSGGVDMEEP